MGFSWPRPAANLLWMGLQLLGLLAVVDASNLPLLSGTLRTFQVHACDGDDLVMECQPTTVININLAQYGRQVPSSQLCPPLRDSPRPANETTECMANEALRYSILQTVEAACREQVTCKIKTSPESFGGDPCPGTRKYAEVAYKCRPHTFFNKIICEGDRLRLRCQKSLRIIIYSAAFGGTHYDVPECPQPQGVKGQDCQVSYATETVMSSCHNKRKCSVGADLGTFGSPGCPQGVRHYLKVVYACVPKEILKEFGSSSSSEMDETKEQEDDYPTSVDEQGFIHPASSRGTPMAQPPQTKNDRTSSDIKSNVHSQIGPAPTLHPTVKKGAAGGAEVKPTTKSDMQSDENIDVELSDANCTEEQRIIGFLTEWINAYNYVKSNKEKFILYLTLSLGAGLVAFLSVLAVRFFVRLRRRRSRSSKMRISEPLSSAYGGDDLAELDAAFDDRLTTTALTGTLRRDQEAARYANGRGSARRQDGDAQPRATLTRNNFYYS